MHIELHLSTMIKMELNLTRKEFDWLKALLQNPIYEDESNSESIMREKWWSALDDAWKNFIPF